MSEIIIYDYTTGSDPASAWTNPGNAYDGNGTTYANKSIAAGTDETTKYLLFSAFVGTIPNWRITKVEVGISHYDAALGTSHVHFKAMFGGSSPGPVHELIHVGGFPQAPTITYTDITSDSGAPSPWLYTDVTTLDIQAWYHNPTAWFSFNGYLHEIYIRITYTALYYMKLVGGVLTKFIVNTYLDNTDMTHYLGMGIESDVVYSKIGAVGSANQTDVRVHIDGNTYSLLTYRS